MTEQLDFDPSVQAPSQSLDWQALPALSNRRFAYGKTGGAFVATSGSEGYCSSPSVMG
jgi:hypothetical protein